MNKAINLEKIIRWVDKILEISLWGLIFTLPFSKSMLEIFFFAALVSWVLGRILKHKRGDSLFKLIKLTSTDLNLPIAVFAAINFISMLTSVSLSLSLEGFFLKLGEGLLIYFILIDSINTRGKIMRLLMVLISSMILISFDGIFQSITGTDFLRGKETFHNIHSVTASFGNPNDFAVWLIIMIPMALILAYFWKKKERYLTPILWATSAILMACLILTHSRSAFVALMVSLLVVGIFKAKRLGIALVLIFVVLFIAMPDLANTFFMKTNRKSIFTLENRTVAVRKKTWIEAGKIIKDHPLVGSGPNTYAYIAPQYKVSEETGIYPHNSYLRMAAESGILGLGAFLWMLAILFRTLFGAFKRVKDSLYSTLLLGIITGLFAFFMHSFVDTNIYSMQVGMLMWFMIAFGISIQKTAHIENE
ncbi:MAG: O-antigen ligase family protein [Candidatus Omnitrophica bacterium]|nr:O-antigen ligase family protein [Candidatus Omnitrophota bacterium]